MWKIAPMNVTTNVNCKLPRIDATILLSDCVDPHINDPNPPMTVDMIVSKKRKNKTNSIAAITQLIMMAIFLSS